MEQTSRGRKRGGGGGAWRAYVHMESKRQKFDKESLASMAKRYQGLSREKKAELEQIGRQGTLLHGDGGPAFPSFSQRAAGARDRMDGAAREDAQMARGERAHMIETELQALRRKIMSGASIEPSLVALQAALSGHYSERDVSSQTVF